MRRQRRGQKWGKPPPRLKDVWHPPAEELSLGPGRVAFHLDPEAHVSHHVIMLRPLTYGNWVVAALTSDPGWTRHPREATLEETAMAGFAPKRTTYLGFSTKLEQELSPLPQTFPEHRVASLLEEYDGHERERAELCDSLMECLRQGETVSFQARDNSMAPTLRQGESREVEPVSPKDVAPGDLVLVRLHGTAVVRRVAEAAAGGVRVGGCDGGGSRWTSWHNVCGRLTA